MQNGLKVTVWCGMTSDRNVGPFVHRYTVNVERYLTMLRLTIKPVSSTWENIKDLIHIQDGAPPHFAIVVVNGRMPSTLGDGWVVVVRTSGQPEVLT